MAEKQDSVNLDRISVLAAAIMLAYTLLGFVNFPSREIAFEVFGVYLEFTINIQIIIAILVASLTATGADGLVRSNPGFNGGITIQHWLLPALTAWAIGMILFQQPFGPLWWITFIFGGGTLILVLAAEYIVVNPDDPRQIPATIGITSVSFALFLTLAITIYALETRLFLFIPTVSIAFFLTNLRIFHLRLAGDWALTTVLVNTFIVAEVSAALHYFPINPILFGLWILGTAYAVISISTDIRKEKKWNQMIAEPIIAILLVWGISIFIR